MAFTVERNTKALKTVVIVMGVLIVAGMAVVIITVANRLGRSGEASHDAAAPAASAMAVAPGGFGTVDVPLPARCRVATATPAGERLVLQLAGNAEECRQIMVLDLGSGRLLGRLNLVSPAGSAPEPEAQSEPQTPSAEQ
jgi:hypothetical protein